MAGDLLITLAVGGVVGRDIETNEPDRWLTCLVELNEGVKVAAEIGFRVRLLALSAIVTSRRSGDVARGFAEVATQLKSWADSLDTEIRALTGHVTSQVGAASDLAKERRFLALLERTPGDGAALADGCARMREVVEDRSWQLELAGRGTRRMLEELARVEMLASVLSRSALIEAAHADEPLRTELLNVAREFAREAEQGHDVVTRLRRGSQMVSRSVAT